MTAARLSRVGARRNGQRFGVARDAGRVRSVRRPGASARDRGGLEVCAKLMFSTREDEGSRLARCILWQGEVAFRYWPVLDSRDTLYSPNPNHSVCPPRLQLCSLVCVISVGLLRGKAKQKTKETFDSHGTIA